MKSITDKSGKVRIKVTDQEYIEWCIGDSKEWRIVDRDVLNNLLIIERIDNE